jgi:quercetin dioxygenase-like cupin family protein
MSARWQVFHLFQLARYDELPLTNVPLFVEEQFRACLLGFLPGQELPVHLHAHEHKVFDVVQGAGTYARQAIRRAVAKRLGRARR